MQVGFATGLLLLSKVAPLARGADCASTSMPVIMSKALCLKPRNTEECVYLLEMCFRHETSEKV